MSMRPNGTNFPWVHASSLGTCRLRKSRSATSFTSFTAMVSSHRCRSSRPMVLCNSSKRMTVREPWLVSRANKSATSASTLKSVSPRKLHVINKTSRTSRTMRGDHGLQSTVVGASVATMAIATNRKAGEGVTGGTGTRETRETDSEDIARHRLGITAIDATTDSRHAQDHQRMGTGTTEIGTHEAARAENPRMTFHYLVAPLMMSQTCSSSFLTSLIGTSLLG